MIYHSYPLNSSYNLFINVKVNYLQKNLQLFYDLPMNNGALATHGFVVHMS